MKYLFVCITVLFLFFGCGKKGPIELPTGYHDNTIKNAVKLDPPLVPTQAGTNIQQFDLATSATLWTGFSNNREIRTLLKFSLTSATDMDLTATTLSVKLTVERLSITTPLVLQFYRLTKEWEQNNVTWSENKNDTAWTSPGGDYTTTDSFTVTVNPGDTEIILTDAQIRPFITYWKANTAENYGFIIVPIGILDTAMEFVAVHSGIYGDLEEFPTLSYTVNDETKTIIPEIQAHIAHITEVNNNNASILILGDGYHPMFTIDAAQLRSNPDWEILQANLSLIANDTDLRAQFNLPTSTEGSVSFYVYLGTPSADGFTNSYQFSITHTLETGKIILDITNVCKFLQSNTDYTCIIYPASNKTMLRYLPITLGELVLYYREPVGNN